MQLENAMSEHAKWYLRTQDDVFGPETESKLVEWARLGRIMPGQEVSDDNLVWRRVEEVPMLDMRFSIDIGDGKPRGPFNRVAAEALLASGRLPAESKLVEMREPFPTVPADESDPVKTEAMIVGNDANGESADVHETEKADPDAVPVAPFAASESAEIESSSGIEDDHTEAEAEIPLAQAAERDAPKIVEKIVERRVEVPVEKIVEVEKIVVDETRVKELEGLLAEERRHTGDLQARMDAASRSAAETAKASASREAELRGQLRVAEERLEEIRRAMQDAVDRENKYVEQIHSLEDELRRLPQAASEVADIQAAMYSIMTKEAEELAAMLDQEKREAEEFRLRHRAREDRLLERRRELLKRAGVNIEDMTRKALLARPEDPRTAQLRKELSELRRESERKSLDDANRLRDLGEELRLARAELARRVEGDKDVTQLRAEVLELSERLQLREKELMAERAASEQLRQQQATYQQTMMSRLAQLETPSIGTSRTMETNQSREARMVRLPGWMSFKR